MKNFEFEWDDALEDTANAMILATNVHKNDKYGSTLIFITYPK